MLIIASDMLRNLRLRQYNSKLEAVYTTSGSTVAVVESNGMQIVSRRLECHVGLRPCN